MCNILYKSTNFKSLTSMSILGLNQSKSKFFCIVNHLEKGGEDTGQRLWGHRFSTAASQQAEQSSLIEEPEIEILLELKRLPISAAYQEQQSSDFALCMPSRYQCEEKKGHNYQIAQRCGIVMERRFICMCINIVI